MKHSLFSELARFSPHALYAFQDVSPQLFVIDKRQLDPYFNTANSGHGPIANLYSRGLRL